MIESLTWTEAAKIIIPGVIAFITGRYLALKSRRLKTDEETFHKVYLPMHQIIEPYLYKDVDNLDELVIVVKLLEMTCKENIHLVPYRLQSYISDLVKGVKENGKFDVQLFDFVCFDIEREYKRLKSNLGYPTGKSIMEHLNNFSSRRFRTRFKKIESLVSDISFVIIMTIILILVSTWIYNKLVYVVNLIQELLAK